ncbi:MAG: SRPBCC domain-containing protein [Planctomycetes bacterium]|nr:SRPBCC domain-containing protein [Planctomycetota bacterium]
MGNAGKKNAPARAALVIERDFEAPVELVWRAWSEAAHLERWWGPRGFTLPVCELDFRVGGRILLCMRGPDSEIWSTGVYLEIVKHQRIVYSSAFCDEKGNVVPASHYGMPEGFGTDLRVAVGFAAKGGRTKMTLRHEGIPESMFESANGGWSSSFDKLDDALNQRSGTTMDVNASVEIKASDREIVIMREFDAPRELVWVAWTTPELVAQWWGPDGFRIEIDTMDVCVGGEWVFDMFGPDGKRYPNACVFKEVVEPECIVFDTYGGEKDASPKFNSTWIFEDLGKDRTRVTLRLLLPSAKAREHVVKNFGAIEGGKQCLCNFAKFVAKLISESQR